jgi:hypothetical protein
MILEQEVEDLKRQLSEKETVIQNIQGNCLHSEERILKYEYSMRSDCDLPVFECKNCGRLRKQRDND